jgi:hypothetical protein
MLGPNILLNSLFSKTLGLCSSPKVRDQVSHPYSTTGKITVLYTLIMRSKQAVLPNPCLEEEEEEIYFNL